MIPAVAETLALRNVHPHMHEQVHVRPHTTLAALSSPLNGRTERRLRDNIFDNTFAVKAPHSEGAFSCLAPMK